jgi:hypothetical protein
MLPLDISQVAGVEGGEHDFSILNVLQPSFRTPSICMNSGRSEYSFSSVEY